MKFASRLFLVLIAGNLLGLGSARSMRSPGHSLSLKASNGVNCGKELTNVATYLNSISHSVNAALRKAANVPKVKQLIVLANNKLSATRTWVYQYKFSNALENAVNAYRYLQGAYKFKKLKDIARSLSLLEGLIKKLVLVESCTLIAFPIPKGPPTLDHVPSISNPGPPISLTPIKIPVGPPVPSQAPSKPTDSKPTPSSSPAPSPIVEKSTPSPVPVSSSRPSSLPYNAPTPISVVTKIPTPSPTPSSSPTPSLIPYNTPTQNPIPSGSPTLIPSSSPTPSLIPYNTPTQNPIPFGSPTPIPSSSPTPSSYPLPVGSPTPITVASP